MECVICLENLNYNIITLSCSHKYHINCINSWSIKNNFTCYYPKCPLCDIHVDVINIENNNISYDNTNLETTNEQNNIEDTIPLENTNNIRINFKNKIKCCIIL
jgi:hypothetical protein